MSALTADVACLATARLMNSLARLLYYQLGRLDPHRWVRDLHTAAGQVHALALPLHALR